MPWARVYISGPHTSDWSSLLKHLNGSIQAQAKIDTTPGPSLIGPLISSLLPCRSHEHIWYPTFESGPTVLEVIDKLGHAVRRHDLG